MGQNSENACGLHAGIDRYWIGWKEEATIEERDLRDHKVIASYPALPRIARLTKRNGTLWFTDFEEGGDHSGLPDLRSACSVRWIKTARGWLRGEESNLY